MNNEISFERNWIVTIICVLFALFFAYIGIGVWFVQVDGFATSQLVYLKIIIAAISFYGVITFGRLARSGNYRRFKDFLLDLLTAGF